MNCPVLQFISNNPPSLSVKDAWKLLFRSKNSFHRAKLVNVRDSTLMCFTAPVGPTDRPRFFSLYWISQICKHNWSESFNTREGTWPSLGFYKPCIQKTQGWVPLSVACLLWLDQLSFTSEVFPLFHFSFFLLLVREKNAFVCPVLHSFMQQIANMVAHQFCKTCMWLFFIG